MSSEQPTYDERLRLGWTILWRGVGSFVILLFAGNVVLLYIFPELGRTTPTLWVAVMPLTFATLVSALFIMPYIVRRLLKVPFKGCHLRFMRDRSHGQ